MKKQFRESRNEGESQKKLAKADVWGYRKSYLRQILVRSTEGESMLPCNIDFFPTSSVSWWVLNYSLKSILSDFIIRNHLSRISL